ncbi:MAG: hypothetical protein KAJ19_18760 [Gammaproteobacteria bacterium]|nr:hypothetical protein [Gammaproteobacteria bacterium]
MKDRNGIELYPGDWIIISANISTASQALLYGFITKSIENRISIIRENGWVRYNINYNEDKYIKTYMRNSNAILKIACNDIPKQIQNKILRVYNELEE